MLHSPDDFHVHMYLLEARRTDRKKGTSTPARFIYFDDHDGDNV
jgi:hypothetical protein